MSQELTRFIGRLSCDAVRDKLKAGAPAILPIGAGSKQHGLHLPMATDAEQAEWFAVETATRTDGLIWPTLTYGWYPAFTAYAGSVSIDRNNFQNIVLDILQSLLSQTHTCVFVIDTGISTIGPINAAIADCPEQKRICHLPIYRGRHFEATRSKLSQQALGSHADEIETSIMLALSPDTVDLSRAKASPAGQAFDHPGPLSPDEPSRPNYSPSGSFGDPTLASTEKGLELIAAMLRDIDDACARMLPGRAI